MRLVNIRLVKTRQVKYVQDLSKPFKICQYKTFQDKTRQDKLSLKLWQVKTSKDLSKLVKLDKTRQGRSRKDLLVKTCHVKTCKGKANTRQDLSR